MLKSIEVKNEQENGFNKLKRQQKKRKNIEICLIGDNEIFGEDELMQEIPRSYTIICNSTEAEVYRIDKKILFERIFKSSSTMKWLKGYSEWKVKYYEDRIKTLSNPATMNQNGGDNFDSQDFSSNNGFDSLPKPANIRNVSEALIQGLIPSATTSPKADKTLKFSMEISKKSPGIDSPRARIDPFEIENSFIAMAGKRNISTPYERRINKNISSQDPSIELSQNSESKRREDESRKVPNFKSFSDRYRIPAGAVRAGPEGLISERNSAETNPFKTFRGFLTDDALEKNKPKTGREDLILKKLDKIPISDERTDNSPHFQDILKEFRGDQSTKSITASQAFNKVGATPPIRQKSLNAFNPSKSLNPQQGVLASILSPQNQPHNIISYNKAVVGSSRESPNISVEASKQAVHEVQNIHMTRLRSSKSAKSLRPYGKASLDLKKKKIVDLNKISQINNFYEKPNIFNTPIIPPFNLHGSQTTKKLDNEFRRSNSSRGFYSERHHRIPIDEINEEDRNFSITNRQWKRAPY